MSRRATGSLLRKILLSTSLAFTVLLAVTAWVVQRYAVNAISAGLEEEVKSGFFAYESLWQARARLLATVSLVLSNMSDVRAAFSTGDDATIRDTAGELWGRISGEDAVFLVTDPTGRVIASLGGNPVTRSWRDLSVVARVLPRFPQQASGFTMKDGRLYQVVLNPVYVSSARGPALLNILVAGYLVDTSVAQQLKQATGGSEFVFRTHGQVVASTLPYAVASQLPQSRSEAKGGRPERVVAGAVEYRGLPSQLIDVEGKPIGELWILRSEAAAQAQFARLRRNVLMIWLVAILAGLALTYALARRIVEPVKALDRAATEVARQNYAYRVKVESDDELGRLAATFNEMCASIQQARDELIGRERLATIARLSTSIVHDLRNPLAAIYGGSEILVDAELPPAQMKRLAGNIYRASRRVQELLQDLVNVSRGKLQGPEVCSLRELATVSIEMVRSVAEAQGVALHQSIPDGIEVSCERARIERVFLNLLSNALEAMPDGGELSISSQIDRDHAVINIEDNGPGIAPEITGRLFEPFVSAGKKNGLGLGLALSRQTVRDHGCDMWINSAVGHGAKVTFQLPLAPPL